MTGSVEVRYWFTRQLGDPSQVIKPKINWPTIPWFVWTYQYNHFAPFHFHHHAQKTRTCPHTASIPQPCTYFRAHISSKLNATVAVTPKSCELSQPGSYQTCRARVSVPILAGKLSHAPARQPASTARRRCMGSRPRAACTQCNSRNSANLMRVWNSILPFPLVPPFLALRPRAMMVRACTPRFFLPERKGFLCDPLNVVWLGYPSAYHVTLNSR